jgi:hypothetical protein
MAFEKTVKDFQENEKSIVTTAEIQKPADSQPRLQGILDKIRATPEGQDLLLFLEKNNIQFKFLDDEDNIATYKTRTMFQAGKWMPAPGTQFLQLNPEKDDSLLAGAILHEARHAQQAFDGVILPLKQISSFDLIWFVRIKEADAQASATLNAFKAKLSGNSSMFDGFKDTYFKGMCEAAENQYAQDPTSLDDGRLKRTLFDAWFCNEAKYIYNEFGIYRDFNGFNAQVEFFGKSNFSKTPLMVADIEKFGMVGGETVNYLKLPGFRSLNDGYYTDGFTPQQRQQLQVMTQEWGKTPLPEQKPAPNKTSVLKPGG